MRIVRIKTGSLNRNVEIFIMMFLSFLLSITLFNNGVISTFIQGDVGGWSNQGEVLPPGTPDRTNDIASLSEAPSSNTNTRDNKNQKEVNKPKPIDKVITKVPISPSVGNRIASVAKSYASKRAICSIRPESCARCVRKILKDSGCNYKVISSNPLDGWTKPYGPLFANSLWGKDIGIVKGKKDKVLPGDLVFFENTYRGNWWNKSGLVRRDKYNTGKQPYTPVVTHVEIAINSSKMVGKRGAYRPMSIANIKSRFGRKFLGSVTLYAEFCNPDS